MSDPITTVDVPKPGPPAQEAPVETVEPAEVDWKAKAREWERRAKENKTAADELASIRESQKSESEKTAERLAEAERKASEAEARAIRREVALEHSLSKDDAALLDTITDEDAMRRLAARLSAAASDRKNQNPVPREGTNPRPKPDERRAFADFLTGRAS